LAAACLGRFLPLRQTGGPNDGHGLGGNQEAPGAPIGGGSVILLLLGAFYTGKKLLGTNSLHHKQDSPEKI